MGYRCVAQFLKNVVDTFAGVDQDLAVIAVDQQPACGVVPVVVASGGQPSGGVGEGRR